MKLTPLDKLFSESIRRRAVKRVGGCERCLRGHVWKELQCSHFHGRAKKSVRWDEDNSVGLCAGCHMYLTAHPLEHVDWFKNHLGDKFDLLLGRMRDMTKPDIKLLTIYFKRRS